MFLGSLSVHPLCLMDSRGIGLLRVAFYALWATDEKNECNTLLDSTRSTEKDGDPLCHRCYSKEVPMLCSVRPVVRHVCRRLGTSHCSIHD
ncbi:hypothetical protein P692DRAFT_2053107 [Suillus brevipes Sb2]|nr:hypothetical protein P692DRAFT_2053107 [Suillus brevipes Sb2]